MSKKKVVNVDKSEEIMFAQTTAKIIMTNLRGYKNNVELKYWM